MTAELKYCEVCERYWAMGATDCAVCRSDLVTRVVPSLRIVDEVRMVVCRGCGHLFDRAFTGECPECGKQYIPTTMELLPPQSEAQKQAVRHAQAVVERLRAQEQTFADVQLTGVNVYRPLPAWKRWIRMFLRRVKL